VDEATVEEAPTAEEEGEVMGREAVLMEGEAVGMTVKEGTEDPSVIEKWVQSQLRRDKRST
jgi:hypothetical protein